MFRDDESGREYRLIGGQNCVPETAFREFMATKIQHGKDSGVFYKHYVQSFKPNENVTPQQVHEIAMELSKYFVGFEVLVATHIDEDHWHSHLIVNSVNVDTGLKIQFGEKNLRELRKFSDEICQSHGLKILKPYEKNSPVAGINTREYRAAQRGESWKFKLMSAIDSADKISQSKDDFIANMERVGYSVKWEKQHKYITYTTPEGQRCRDNRLHDEKYLKESMEQKYELRQTERIEQARKSVGAVPNDNPDVRNSARGFEQIGADDDRNSETPNPNARANRRITDMGELGAGHSAENHGRNEKSVVGDSVMRKQTPPRLRGRGKQIREEDFGYFEQQVGKDGGNTSSTGQHTEAADVAMDWNRGNVADSALRLALGIEQLFDVKGKKLELEQGEKQRQKSEQKNYHKKKKSHGHDMSR